MSIMNSAEAARLALDEAAQHLDNVIVIYVEPDKTARPLSFTKRLSLPEADDLQLPFARGCALAGALPVLDLHALEDAPERFAAALRSIGADRTPPMVVRVSDCHLAPIAGARVIAPKNPRELAGALRYAFRSGEICVVAENPLNAYESCEVPDDWDELFGDALEMPSDASESGLSYERTAVAELGDTVEPSAAEVPAEDEKAAAQDDGDAVQSGEYAASAENGDIFDGESDSAQAEDDAESAEERQTVPDAEPVKAPDGELASEPAESPARLVIPAFRSRRYDSAELERTARLLAVPREALMRLCCRRAEDMAEIVIEADAESGEIACLPPRERVACLWVGADALTLCWDSARLNAAAARALLNDVTAYLMLPARLLLDKEN